MKLRSITISILLAGLCFALTQCKQPAANQQRTLSVTIDPQKYFLESIVGDKYEINCIVPPGSNPESYDAAPSRMMALSKSIAYFKVGYMGIENMLIEKVISNNPHLTIIDCSEGITVIGEAHDHGNGHGNGHEDHVDCAHGHEGGDPHTWSSPNTARVMAKNMYNAMLRIDSVNSQFYTERYAQLTTQLDETDNTMKSLIDKATSKAFVIYHPALSYFAEEYGLSQLAIESEGKSPSPSQLKKLIDESKAAGVKVVFIQQEFDTKNAETVAQAIGAQVVQINLLSSDWHTEMIKIARAIAGTANDSPNEQR